MESGGHGCSLALLQRAALHRRPRFVEGGTVATHPIRRLVIDLHEVRFPEAFLVAESDNLSDLRDSSLWSIEVHDLSVPEVLLSGTPYELPQYLVHIQLTDGTKYRASAIRLSPFIYLDPDRSPYRYDVQGNSGLTEVDEFPPKPGGSEDDSQDE